MARDDAPSNVGGAAARVAKVSCAVPFPGFFRLLRPKEGGNSRCLLGWDPAGRSRRPPWGWPGRESRLRPALRLFFTDGVRSWGTQKVPACVSLDISFKLKIWVHRRRICQIFERISTGRRKRGRQTCEVLLSGGLPDVRQILVREQYPGTGSPRI